jgi:hypothetical protein
MLALSRVYRRTGRDDIRQILVRAVKLTESAQNRRGGWRYQPIAFDDDLSVTACQMTALAAAREAGIPVSGDTFQKGLDYVRSCALPRGGFGYQPGREELPVFTRTSAGTAVLIANDGNAAMTGKELDVLNNGSLNEMCNDPYFYCGLQYYSSLITASRPGPGRKIYEFFKTRQNKNGSWTSNFGNSYATASVLNVLQKIKVNV